MNILVTLLIYIVLFALLFYVADLIMTNLGAAPKLQGIVKAIIAIIAFFFLLALFFSPGELPTIQIK